MKLEQVRLYNFRCYPEAEIFPDARFNVIYGLNGQGKTSVLEAIGLLTFLRSFRNAKNAEMLRFGQSEGLVSGRVSSGDLSYQLAVKVWPNRKQATFNGKSCKYLSEYVGRLSSVSFSPTDLEIVRGSPENRRVWIDKLAQVIDPTHADAVARYQKILEHRNRQLKAVSEGRQQRLGEDFETWTDELVLWGSKIIHNRIHSVDKTGDRIEKYYGQIAGENVPINIEYQSEILAKLTTGHATPYSLELLSQALRIGLQNSLPKEQILGTTIVGPHRDDLAITMASHPVRAFGSQGEVRSLVLAMRLTEVETCKDVQGVSPILLIDDFSSELDSERRKFLLDYLCDSESQVFLSTTEELRLGKEFYVENCEVIPKRDQVERKGTLQHVNESSAD